MLVDVEGFDLKYVKTESGASAKVEKNVAILALGTYGPPSTT